MNIILLYLFICFINNFLEDAPTAVLSLLNKQNEMPRHVLKKREEEKKKIQ